MLIIGVTGGSGGGKTTLLREAEKRGALVLDCDEIYHALLRTSSQMLGEIDARFPGTVENGVLARRKLGKLVFDDPDALQELNTITHRYVDAEVKRRLREETTAPFAVIDAIGLLESGLDRLCTVTVAITAPEAVRISRLMAREGISEDYARARIHAQKPDSYYETHCTHTLYNNHSTREAFAEEAGRFLDGLYITQEKESSL